MQVVRTDEPANLSAEERLHELARILARGYRRWLRAQLSLNSAQGNSKANGGDGLDSLGKQSVNRDTARTRES